MLYPFYVIMQQTLYKSTSMHNTEQRQKGQRTMQTPNKNYTKWAIKIGPFFKV